MNLQMLKKAMLAYVSAVKFIWSAIAYPLSIVGKKLMNLRGYRVYGNSVQDGAPTPDNHVEIESVGDLSTKNLLDIDSFDSFDTSQIKYDTETKIITNNRGMYGSGAPFLSNITSLDVGVYSISCEVLPQYKDAIYIGVRGLDAEGNFKVYQKNLLGENNPPAGVWTRISGSITVDTHIAMTERSNRCGIVIQDGGWAENYTSLNLQIRNIMIAEGDAATDYEPYHKYKIPVIVRGKNLLPTPTFSTFTKNGVKFTNNKDGTITINGTPTAYTATDNLYLPDSSLEILRNNVCVLTGFHNYEKNIGLVLAIGLNGNWIKYIYLNPNTYKNYVKVDLTNVEFDTVVFAVRVQNNDILIDNLTIKPLLEVGTTMPTAFEPYRAPVTTNIFLNEPLRKVGDYADYIDYEKRKVVRNVEVLDDTGTKTIDESLGVNNPPIEETVNLPALPQFKGTTIYEVGTSIKPSGMEAKYC